MIIVVFKNYMGVLLACLMCASLILTGLLVLTRINTQSTAAILGCAVGVYFHYMHPDSADLTKQIIGPWTTLLMYYPLVIIKLVYCTDYLIYWKARYQILVMVTFGYPIHVLVVGLMLAVVTGEELDILKMMVIGVIPTPIDVPDHSAKVEHMHIMEGFLNMESLMGNAVGFLVLFECFRIYERAVYGWVGISVYLVWHIVLAVLIGWIFGGVLKHVYKYFFDDSCNACTFLFTVAYIVFFVCERVLECNGTIACSIAVLEISRMKRFLSKKTKRQVESFYDCMYFVGVRVAYFALFARISYVVMPKIRLEDMAGGLALYFAATAMRFLMFISLFPVLKRIGHGFGFPSLITMFWAPKKGPAQIIMARMVLVHPIADQLKPSVFGHWYFYLLYVNIINVATVRVIMKKMGFLDLSVVRKNNISACFTHVDSQRKKQIQLLKMDRFYSGVNWPIVYSSTALVNSVVDVATEVREKPVMICPNCSNEIPIELSAEDLAILIREAKLRILKRKKMSFINQFDEELINEDCMRMLLLACETAFESDETSINIDNLLYILRNKNLTGILSYLQKRFIYRGEYNIQPLNPSFRRCYRIASFKYFELVIFFVIVINIATNIYTLIYKRFYMREKILSMVLIHVFYCVYLVEFLIKLFAHSTISVRMGFRNFWKFYWNRVDFVLLLLNTVELVVLLFCVLLYHFKLIGNFKEFIGYVQIGKAIRLVRILKILGVTFNSISVSFETAIDHKLGAAFAMGTALVIGYEEVLDTLSNITSNHDLKESLRLMMLVDRSAITKELATLNNDKPWVVTYLKTQQVVSSVLKTMNDALMDLSTAGLVDSFEYRKLMKQIDQLRMRVLSIHRMTRLQPRNILYETPWLSCEGLNETDMLNVIEKDLVVMIWNTGEIVCSEGDIIDGIYMLISGLLKSTYTPTEEDLEELDSNGTLPTKDYIRNMNFDVIEETFFMVGNSMGELSVLTGRPYSSKIRAELPSQAFLIPTRAIKKAMSISDDPIFGLECRMWKYISIYLVRRILRSTPIYMNKTNMELNLILNRAFVPDLRCFSLFVINKYIEDVILIEGIIVDAISKELISAPAYIPRNIHKITFYRDMFEKEYTTNKTKLLLIPIADIDEYDVLRHTEHVSVLVPNHSDVCLLAGKNIKRRQHRRRVGVRNMYQAINSIGFTS